MNRIIFAVFLAVSLSSCASGQPPEVIASRDPAVPNAGRQNASYETIIGAYHHRVAVDPKPWRHSNDSQAPQKKTHEGAGS